MQNISERIKGIYGDKLYGFIAKAMRDYEDINLIIKVVNGTNITLETLCDKLGGHNLEDDLFDLNFKSITCTIHQINGVFSVSSNVEIWDDLNCELISQNFEMEEEE